MWFRLAPLSAQTKVSMMKLSTLLFLLCIFGYLVAQDAEHLTNPPGLTHRMSEEEAKHKHLIGADFIITPPPPGPVRNVAEFERMQAVLIRYPFGISYTVIKEMADDIHVITIVSGTTQQNTVLNNYISNGVNISNCSFLIAPTNTYWTRDYGPWFVFDGNGQPAIVDFPYNRPRPLDNEIPVAMATHLSIGLFGMNVIHTGGNYMTNGLGISASSDLVYTENPSLTPAQINQYFNNFLGIQTYHVVPDPNNTYIDHIDCWGKFLGPDKILIREVPPGHSQYAAIEATAAYFANQLSSYGEPFQVFRVNTPNNQPYTNSLILNKKVLVPIMNSSYDNAALAVYQNAMPGYEIVGVTGSWESTDALHCRTMGIADIGMLHIHHIPLSGIQPDTNQYLIEAQIKAHSNSLLKTDSLFIIYSLNDASWDTVTMSLVSGNLFSGNINVPLPGSKIEYYLFAADHSGRRETHPFIGQPDPHEFYAGTPAWPEIDIDISSLEYSLPAGFIANDSIEVGNSGGITLNYEASVTYTNKSKSVVQVHPLQENYRTGSVTSSVLTQTSLVKGFPPNEAGWMTFDISQIPVGATINSIEFNGYVNATYYPYWNINPVATDPLNSTPSVLYNDIIAEVNTGFYLFREETSGYSTGWKTHILGGNANMDMQNALSEGWFAIGIMDRDNVSTYYIHFDGWAEANPPYLVVDYDYTPSWNWLTINGDITTEDSVPSLGVSNIQVGIDATGMDVGIYNANITINSNDPDIPVLNIPVTLNVIDVLEVNLKIYLEGAYEGPGMTTILNQSGLLPLSHPYGQPPWNYVGTETVPAMPNSNIVDWVLVEFRDAASTSEATSATRIDIQAAFLLNDGSIKNLDGASPLSFNGVIQQQLFVLVHHRNHIGVISAFPATIVNGVVEYDFTTSLGSAYGGNLGFKEVASGICAMVSGDADGDGGIGLPDKTAVWTIQSGSMGYFTSDFNMDGQVNNQDKNDLWMINNGFENQIPD
jgi:agmatine deiminase